MSKCKCFLPIVNSNSRILILGSMPSVKSIEYQQYYAHPQNRFWKLMGLFCGQDLYNADYKTRTKVLLDNNFALWDVIGACERDGSLDSNIKNEIPNKIPQLLKKYNNITTIFLNGNKAYSSFKKHFPQLLQDFNCYKMPSTSPANAKYNLESLFSKWSKIS